MSRHSDIIGTELKIGDGVTALIHGSLAIGVIIDFTPRMVRVQQITQRSYSFTKLVYPDKIVKLDQEQLSFHLLQNV